MQARYYNLVIRRFYSNDPVDAISYLNTPAGIQVFNKYAYANNNPYKYLDPNGETRTTATGAGVGFTVGGPVGAVVGGAIGFGVGLWIGNEIADAVMNESAPDLPDGLVGTQDDPRAGPSRGKRHNSAPLSPENGGTGNAQEDFETLTGGTGEPNPDRPPGSLTGENGITIRPGKEGEGPRIDIPANGDKPPETLHYPEEAN